jgi:hypothetical protein
VLKGSFLVGSDHRILKRDGFRVVFGEPFFRGFLIGKNLEVVEVADLFRCVDVNPRCFHGTIL